MRTIKKIVLIIFIIFILWITVSSGIQRFKCDVLTETQLLKELPNNFLYKFKEC